MCKFESLQNDESRDQSADYSTPSKAKQTVNFLIAVSFQLNFKPFRSPRWQCKSLFCAWSFCLSRMN